MRTAAKTDFREQRRTYIGGSDIAAVMGLSRWKTPLQLWAEKTGRIRDEVESEAAELGTELEDFVAKKFEKKSGLKVRRDRRLFTLDGAPYCAANIDRRIVGTDELLECKTCGAWKAKEWEGEDVPLEYCLQVNWYCGIVGMKAAYLAVLIGGQKFVFKRLDYDEELFTKQLEAAARFWVDFVQADKPPQAISGDSDALMALYPESKGELIEVTDPEKAGLLNGALERRQELKREIETVEKELDTIEVQIKQVVGEAPGILTDRFKVTWTPQVSWRADPEAMKKAGVFEQYSKEIKTRVLRIKANKGEKNNGN